MQELKAQSQIRAALFQFNLLILFLQCRYSHNNNLPNILKKTHKSVTKNVAAHSIPFSFSP